MAPFGLKLWGNAFQTIPDISFFKGKNTTNKASVCKTLSDRLPPEDGSVRPQTLGKRVSGDPRHLIVRRRKQIVGKIFRRNILSTFLVDVFSGVEK